MSIVTLRLPNVNPRTEIRPNVCPYCSGETFQRWGRVLKPVELLVDSPLLICNNIFTG
jgi:hypothetical protein